MDYNKTEDGDEKVLMNEFFSLENKELWEVNKEKWLGKFMYSDQTVEDDRRIECDCELGILPSIICCLGLILLLWKWLF